MKFKRYLKYLKKNDNNLLKVEPKEEFHKLTFDELVKNFNTSLKDGLDNKIALELLTIHGKNVIKPKKNNYFLKILNYLFTGFCGLLWISSIVCILAWKPIGNPSDPSNLGLGILLLIVILLQAAFSAFQDWSSGRVMKSIKNMMPSSATVIRNGTEQKIPVENIVIGDLVLLAYGNKVPADVRIIESHDLKFDKSMLTGESEAIEGTIECTDDRYIESKNIGFMTTLITNGQGKGLVIATGDQTVMGKIAKMANNASIKTTSLQKELQRFVLIVGGAAITMAVVVAIVWATWLRVQYPTYIDIPTFLVNTITVMIAFIPEGLPVCVTLSLLIIAKRMAKSRVLVKNLAVIETLSCVNVIASDKTGTLTQNKMFVASAAVGCQNIDLKEVKSPNFERSIAFNQLIAACNLCNNASFEENDKNVSDIRQRKANGDATDIALLRFSSEYEYPENSIKSENSVLAEIPFNSRNKWMAKIIKPKAETDKAIFGADEDINSEILLLKGAPDYLLKKSKCFIMPDGTEKQLDSDIINNIIKLQNEWCIHGQRVLLMCKKRVNNSQTDISDLEGYVNRSDDFCIIGLVGIIDPPREGISDVISKCRKAGIRVFMVTGDYSLTAAAIAVQIGIYTASQFDTVELMRVKHKENNTSYENSALLLTGSDLENLTPQDWQLITPYKEIVFARTTPEQKLRVVKEFQNDGCVVGVTGDGVNDAPALKCADIGIAMGTGSEVAMEASQLVLLDNNFSSILIAIRNGRLVFKNLRKVILYLLPGGCLAELISVLMSIFIGVSQNLSSFQMIIISLFTDIAPSLSLMMEKEEVDLLDEPPRSKKDHLVDWKFILQAYFFIGIMVVISSHSMFFIYMQWYGGLSAQQLILSFNNLPSIYNSTHFNKLYPNPTNSTIDLTSIVTELYYRGQTVTFASIVIIQIFGNLMCTRTSVKSFFQQAQWKKSTRNLYVFGAQLISLCIMILIIYVPPLNDLFNSRPIPVQFLFLPLAFCLVIFLVEELRKYFVRIKFLFFHKIGW